MLPPSRFLDRGHVLMFKIPNTVIILISYTNPPRFLKKPLETQVA